MFKKKSLIFLLLLIGILTISSVSANEILNDSDNQVIGEENIAEIDSQKELNIDLDEDNAILNEDDEDYEYYPGFECSNYYNDAYVNLTLPKNAEGNLVVSLIEYDDDYDEIYTEIGNVKLVDGKASIKLPCSELISYEYMAEYTGSDYKVESVDEYISIVPKVIYSPKVWIGQDNYMSFQMPENEQLGLLLYQNYDLVTETLIHDGSKIKLTNLSEGYIDYYLTYYDYLTYYEVGEKWVYDSSKLYLQVMQDSPNFKLNVTVSDEVIGSDSAYLQIQWPFDHLYFEDMITIILDGDESKAFKTDRGYFYIPISNLAMGIHTVDVICKADEYYNESRAHTTFDINYIAVNVDENYDYGSEIYVDLIENATGYSALYIDGKIHSVIFPNEEFYLTNITMGDHSYEIRYSGDEIYPPYSKKGKFNIDYYSYLNLNKFYNYGEDIEINVSFDYLATGNVIFTVDGKNYTVKIVDGDATLKLPKLSKGRYPVTVTYLGNEIFGPKTLKDEFEIDYEIIIEDNYVNLTLPQDAKGHLIVSLYDKDDNLLKKYYHTLKDGKASISLTGMDYGEYYVDAYYDGEDYFISDASSPIWVGNYSIVSDIKVNWPEDIIFNSDAYITIDLPEKADKSLLNVTLLDINGKVIIDAVDSLGDRLSKNNNLYKNGKVIIDAVGQTNIKIPTTQLGLYHLKVDYDEGYLEDTYLEVLPLKLDVPDWYDDVKLGEIISVEMPENAKGKIILTFFDRMNGRPIKMVESSPSVAGKTSIVLENLTQKRYILMIDYVDEIYGNYFRGLNMQIVGQDINPKFTAFNNPNSTTFNLNLNDDAGGLAVLVINNQIYNCDVNHGTAVFNIPKSDSKIIDAYVCYSGDDKYSNFKKNVSVKIISAPVIVASNVKVAYNDAKNLVVTLKDENGVFLDSKQITIELNGQTYSRITNSKGQASISVPTNLVPKNYIAKIKFAGDESYLLKDASVKIVVVKSSVKLTAKKASFKVKTKTKLYSVTLKNNKNKAVKNVKVTLKVKGKTYSAKTNSKGKATFKINKLTKKGTFKSVVRFAGNKYYKIATKTINLTVK